MKHEHLLKSYFQPKLLLRGQSVASNDFVQFKNTIKSLKMALSMPAEEAKLHLSVANSPLESLWEINNVYEDTERAKNITEYFFDMMGINRF
jgi:hypothetical protein